MNFKQNNRMGLIIIILLLMVIAIMLYFHFREMQVVMLSSESLILTFVGILATFIVVGNAQQVREVKTDMHEELRERKEDLNAKIQELRNEINNKCSENSNQISNLSTDFSEEKRNVHDVLDQLRRRQEETSQNVLQYKEEVSADINHNSEKCEDNTKRIERNEVDVYNLKNKYETVSKSVVNIIHSILILNADDTSQLLLMLLFQNKTFYKIQLDNEETIQAAILYENENLLFIDTSADEIIDNSRIQSIEGLRYDSARVLELYGSIQKLISDEGDVSPVDEHTTDTVS